MPPVRIRAKLILGEQADAPIESGGENGVVTCSELRNFMPMLPVGGDNEGGAQLMPGFKIEGDAQFQFVPGLSHEPGTSAAAGSSRDSVYYRKHRLFVANHPDLSGDIVGVVDCSDGNDARCGRFSLLYQENWGYRVAVGGGQSLPLTGPAGAAGGVEPVDPEDSGDPDNPTVVTPTPVGDDRLRHTFDWTDAAGDVESYSVYFSQDEVYANRIANGTDSTATDTILEDDALNLTASSSDIDIPDGYAGVLYWWVLTKYTDGRNTLSGPWPFELEGSPY